MKYLCLKELLFLIKNMAQELRRMNLYYWAPEDDCWGHAALGLSDGTHISWWPSTAIGANKKFVGLAPAAVV